MQHPWESLAIIGLAALALTGIGAVASVAGFGALGGGLGSYKEGGGWTIIES